MNVWTVRNWLNEIGFTYKQKLREESKVIQSMNDWMEIIFSDESWICIGQIKKQANLSTLFLYGAALRLMTIITSTLNFLEFFLILSIENGFDDERIFLGFFLGKLKNIKTCFQERYTNTMANS